jgi:quercetin dioxygenase-like cupin family protein
MSAAIENIMRYYSRERLLLTTDVQGAKQWAVALKNTMLPYFEVEPKSRFDTHSHESEQIALVLEGVLYFEQGDTIIAVKAGDVIAIPSNAPHAVFTRNEAAKTVDAWSPLMAKY